MYFMYVWDQVWNMYVKWVRSQNWLRVCVCRFRLVPFLVELRAVMDWVWTDTTLSLSNWMCVEDIYANIFIIKCSRETEKVWKIRVQQSQSLLKKCSRMSLFLYYRFCNKHDLVLSEPPWRFWVYWMAPHKQFGLEVIPEALWDQQCSSENCHFFVPFF